MSDLTAAQVKRDAKTRLILLAEGHRSYRGPYDPDKMRAVSIDKLYTWALANAHARGELDTARVEIDLIYPVARGDTTALYDAVQAGGVGALVGDGEPPPLSAGELEEALADWGVS